MVFVAVRFKKNSILRLATGAPAARRHTGHDVVSAILTGQQSSTGDGTFKICYPVRVRNLHLARLIRVAEG